MNIQNAQQQVKDWMLKAGQDCPSHPTIPSLEVRKLRLALHHEEAVEELSGACDLTEIADSIADSLVVVLGTACACGIDIAPIFEEVMRSNNSKFIDGHRREDGKWMKGPSYSPANIEPLIDLQRLQNE